MAGGPVRRGARTAWWPVALFAVLLQVLAPLWADGAVAAARSDPLAGAAICSHGPGAPAAGPAHGGGRRDGQGPDCPACRLCCVGHAVAQPPAPTPPSPVAAPGPVRYSEWRPAAARAPPSVPPRARSPPPS